MLRTLCIQNPATVAVHKNLQTKLAQRHTRSFDKITANRRDQPRKTIPPCLITISRGELNNPRRAHMLVAVRAVLHLVSATSIVVLSRPELKCVSCVLQHPD